MLKNKLLRLLCFNQHFAEHEQHLRYKVVYLNSVFLLAAVVAFGMGFYRWQVNPLMGMIDFGFVLVAIALLFYLKHHRDKIDVISTIALTLSFTLFYAIYLLAPYQTNRLSLFFLLAAAAFFLKGLRGGVRWLIFIIVSIVAAHFIPAIHTGYSGIDILTTCLYLIALFLIFWNYETLKDDQSEREQEHRLQSLIDERWRLALEGVGDAIWDWNLQTKQFVSSRSYAEMLGYSEEEIGHSQDHLASLLHPEDRARAATYLAAYVSGEIEGQYISEQRLRCKDGNYKWILCRGNLIERRADGKPLRMVGTHVDVTERKRTEESLRESENRLHMALDSAQMGVWEYDLITQELYWSPEVFRLFGLGYFHPTLDAFQQMIHAEDALKVQAAMDKAINERIPFFVEFRFGEAGNLGWAEDRGEVQYDGSGKPLRVVGTVQDITERKKVQEDILRSRQELGEERRLFQTILDNVPMGIWMVDAKGKVQFINQGFCNSTGISESRFLAADHYAEVFPQSVAASCIRSDKECLAQQLPHISSEWLPFVDGRDHLMEITKVRLLNRDGSIKGLIGLAADVTEREEHERQLEHIAHYDPLTGVPNRVMLADRLSQALARTKRDKSLMAVCYLDLDGFKPINDTYGHETGDKVLVEISKRIKKTIREDDTVARLGGDEFVVLLVGMQVPEECVGSLHRLLDIIKLPIEVHGNAISISASIGVALFPEDDQDADTLLRHADQAMYVAKQSGKNRYHLFDAANDLRARSHHQLLLQIRHGLAHGEFELYYQPKVELTTRRMLGVEALIRWHHPQRGLLFPGAFLRAIEETALEIELGEWVIAKALEQMLYWREAGNTINVSVNISAYHLQSEGFVGKLHEAIQDLSKEQSTGCLQIEVLETAALEDVERIGNIIHSCREFGVSFALDDFGTGYSSLKYLSFFDLDTLKIDQSFVHDMMVEKGDHAIVQGIVALAKAFGRESVAEGVETEAQYQALLLMGCDVGQGYGIARPMPAGALIGWQRTYQK